MFMEFEQNDLKPCYSKICSWSLSKMISNLATVRYVNGVWAKWSQTLLEWDMLMECEQSDPKPCWNEMFEKILKWNDLKPYWLLNDVTLAEWVFTNGLRKLFSARLPICSMDHLTLKVLNFWKFTSYCSLKPLWSGMGEVVPAHTSPTLHPPSPPTVHQLSRIAL